MNAGVWGPQPSSTGFVAPFWPRSLLCPPGQQTTSPKESKKLSDMTPMEGLTNRRTPPITFRDRLRRRHRLAGGAPNRTPATLRVRSSTSGAPDISSTTGIDTSRILAGARIPGSWPIRAVDFVRATAASQPGRRQVDDGATRDYGRYDRQLVRVTRRERRSPRERVHQRASDNQGEPRTPPGRDVGEDLFRSRMSRKALASGTSRMCE